MASTTHLIIFSILLIPLTLIKTQSLTLPLTHTLSTTQFPTTHHLLKSTTTKSTSRHRNRRQISLPLSPGSDYTLSFSLNSQTLSLYMDTGSDLVWFPCSPFECILCEGKTTPSPINVSSSSLLTCQSRACSSAHSSLPSSDLCAAAKCPLDRIETSDCQNFHCPAFYYAYGDGSLVGNLHRETLKMGPSFSLPNFTFGCSHSALAEPIGVAGFGRGFLSFPNQLASLSPQLGNQFSYCLVSHSFDSTRIKDPSPLILGRSRTGEEEQKKQRKQRRFDSGKGKIVYHYTPMLYNPKHPYFYSVGLEAVSVGPTRIPAPENLKRVDRRGNGGVVVDSGTTLTMLPTSLYRKVAGELGRRLDRGYKRDHETEGRTGLSPCYYMNGPGSGFEVPGMVFHFGGNSSVVLPQRNYFYEFMEGEKEGRKVGCLMMMDGGDEGEGGPGMTLGNYQQQGFEVVYDLENRRVGFARRTCSDMWEELGR